jgi:hypothetical protein
MFKIMAVICVLNIQATTGQNLCFVGDLYNGAEFTTQTDCREVIQNIISVSNADLIDRDIGISFSCQPTGKVSL